MTRLFITTAVGHGGKHVLPAMGPLYIAAVAKQKGCDVYYQDAYLDKPSWNQFNRKISMIKPDIIGVSCNAEDRLAAIKTAKKAKEFYPKSFVVMGGPFATMAHEEIINKLNFVDIVIRGEGEKQIVDIIDFISNRKKLKDIRGITYRGKKGKAIINDSQELIKDLNELPMPYFSLLKIREYKSYIPSDKDFDDMRSLRFVSQSRTDYPMASLIFSRGCPFDCLFCSAKAMWSRRYRIMSPQKAVDQVRYFVERNVVDFVFQDDHLLTDKTWFDEFSSGLKKISKDYNKKIRYACSARIDSIDQETAKKIYESGGRMITIGIENLSDHTLGLMKKQIKTEQIWKVLDILHENKIIVRGGVLINTPGETFDDIKDNIRLHSRLRKYLIQPGALAPLKIYPGSDLEKIARQKGVLDGFSWVDDYYNPKNHILSSSPHIPIFENKPSEKVLYFLILESLRHKDHYLSRIYLREHLKGVRKRPIRIRLKEACISIKSILVYLISGPINKIIERLFFLKKVFTEKEARV